MHPLPKRLALLAALGAGLAGCSRSPAPAAAPAPAPSATPAGGAHVTAVAPLRRDPGEAARVRGPGGKEVVNVLATLQRGERVTVLEEREDWARVRSSDDQEGWMKSGVLLEGEGVTEATVLVPADVFDRPDLLAANARRKIDPGTLVLVVRTRPPFSEVNLAAGQNAWVLSERLAAGEREVSVAKLTEKARWLVRVGRKDEALQVLALARTQFAGSPLVDALAVELGEGPPPAAAPAPAPSGPEAAPPPAPAPVQPTATPGR